MTSSPHWILTEKDLLDFVFDIAGKYGNWTIPPSDFKDSAAGEEIVRKIFINAIKKTAKGKIMAAASKAKQKDAQSWLYGRAVSSVKPDYFTQFVRGLHHSVQREVKIVDAENSLAIRDYVTTSMTLFDRFVHTYLNEQEVAPIEVTFRRDPAPERQTRAVAKRKKEAETKKTERTKRAEKRKGQSVQNPAKKTRVPRTSGFNMFTVGSKETGELYDALEMSSASEAENGVPRGISDSSEIDSDFERKPLTRTVVNPSATGAEEETLLETGHDRETANLSIPGEVKTPQVAVPLPNTSQTPVLQPNVPAAKTPVSQPNVPAAKTPMDLVKSYFGGPPTKTITPITSSTTAASEMMTPVREEKKRHSSTLSRDFENARGHIGRLGTEFKEGTTLAQRLKAYENATPASAGKPNTRMQTGELKDFLRADLVDKKKSNFIKEFKGASRDYAAWLRQNPRHKDDEELIKFRARAVLEDVKQGNPEVALHNWEDFLGTLPLAERRYVMVNVSNPDPTGTPTNVFEGAGRITTALLQSVPQQERSRFLTRTVNRIAYDSKRSPFKREIQNDEKGVINSIPGGSAHEEKTWTQADSVRVAEAVAGIVVAVAATTAAPALIGVEGEVLSGEAIAVSDVLTAEGSVVKPLTNSSDVLNLEKAFADFTTVKKLDFGDAKMPSLEPEGGPPGRPGGSAPGGPALNPSAGAQQGNLSQTSQQIFEDETFNEVFGGVLESSLSGAPVATATDTVQAGMEVLKKWKKRVEKYDRLKREGKEEKEGKEYEPELPQADADELERLINQLRNPRGGQQPGDEGGRPNSDEEDEEAPLLRRPPAGSDPDRYWNWIRNAVAVLSGGVLVGGAIKAALHKPGGGTVTTTEPSEPPPPGDKPPVGDEPPAEDGKQEEGKSDRKFHPTQVDFEYLNKDDPTLRAEFYEGGADMVSEVNRDVLLQEVDMLQWTTFKNYTWEANEQPDNPLFSNVIGEQTVRFASPLIGSEFLDEQEDQARSLKMLSDPVITASHIEKPILRRCQDLFIPTVPYSGQAASQDVHQQMTKSSTAVLSEFHLVDVPDWYSVKDTAPIEEFTAADGTQYPDTERANPGSFHSYWCEKEELQNQYIFQTSS